MNEIFKTSLTSTEKQAARKLEAKVERGLQSYVETGRALKAIRDRKLHTGSFRSYVQTRFGIKYGYARRLIQASEVAENLQAEKLAVPKNEAQAQVLSKYDCVEQVEIWKQVLDAKKPITAKLIQRVIDDLYPPVQQPNESEPVELPEPSQNHSVDESSKQLAKVVSGLQVVASDLQSTKPTTELLNQVELAQQIINELRQSWNVSVAA